jgi:hypothetical protein
VGPLAAAEAAQPGKGGTVTRRLRRALTTTATMLAAAALGAVAAYRHATREEQPCQTCAPGTWSDR